MRGMNELLRRLRYKYNISYTRYGFYRVGINEGFLTKNGNHYIFDAEKFKEWLNKKIETVPDGWLSIDELADKLNVSRMHAFNIAKRDGVERVMMSIGKKKRAIYVEPESVKKVLQRDKISFDWV